MKTSRAVRPIKHAPASAFFLRQAGTDLPAGAVAQAAAARGDLPVTFLPATAVESDYGLVDNTLHVADAVPATVTAPQPGLGYAGFSEQQRAALYVWMERAAQPAPHAFQQILLANAEVRLLEGSQSAHKAHLLLVLLGSAPAWHGHVGLARTLLLSFWLRQDGGGLMQWATSYQLSADLWSIALGQQALLGQPLDADQLLPLASAWGLPLPELNRSVLHLRLDSLQTELGQEPLAHVLAKLGDAERKPLPWRCQHRDLRLALPQPDPRPLLEPMLRELLAVEPVGEVELTPHADEPAAEAAKAQDAAPPVDKRTGKRKTARNAADDKVHLILEFEASRSELFDFALRQAQKQPGFLQIMDENRHMVYRVPFRRGDMRHFWQLWTYVQNWSSTRVYCEGRQLDPWQIYPYSQYLR